MMMSIVPADHTERLRRARLSLDGLSVGDAFGQQFFGNPVRAELVANDPDVPPGIWPYTDDTEMALSILDVLRRNGQIVQSELARSFAERFMEDQGRGYGGTAQAILRRIGSGTPWEEASRGVFGGAGSMGNGGAMRAAPLGAYFADDYARAVEQARLSAEVTHAHPEGQAGAVAVAVAAAFAWNVRERVAAASGTQMLQCVLDLTPEGETRRGIEKAFSMDRDLSWQTAASWLGNGSQLLSQDTVPYCLWCAAKHLGDYREALWTTVSALGDRDTTCAIVGGIVALSVGPEAIPTEWLRAREPLPLTI